MMWWSARQVGAASAVAALLSGFAAMPGMASGGAYGAVLPSAAAAPGDDIWDSAELQSWSLHGQATYVWQYHPAFTSPYAGPNSLLAGNQSRETFDATLFAGVRLWRGAELYANPEIDQGFGLSNTLGAAGFPSGEAYKIGSQHPYLRLQRLFLRQGYDLGGARQRIEPDANQLAGVRSTDSVVLTLGKFAVTDIFDTNAYAHDPKLDFLNWAIIDAGAFDYAADAWGYSYGAAAEWSQSRWTWRAGLFDLSAVPNSTLLERGFRQFEAVVEAEVRTMPGGQPGKLKLLVFVNRGDMGSYVDALRRAAATGSAVDTALVRRYASRPGATLNIEQQLRAGLGFFLRASANDGSKEAYEFTEINRSVSLGGSLQGSGWGRPLDIVGAGVAVNQISEAARGYLAAGGAGILVGDGRLPDYGSERIAEFFYNAKLTTWLAVGVDYQRIENPAYNRDRGPVSVFGARLHAEF